MAILRRLYRRFLAFWRLDLQVVCEESASMGDYDYHDYDDDVHHEPWHFIHLTCGRCGKKFMI